MADRKDYHFYPQTQNPNNSTDERSKLKSS